MEVNNHQSDGDPSDTESTAPKPVTHETDSRIAPGEYLPPLEVLVEDPDILYLVFGDAPLTLLDGDVTNGKFTDVSSESITLSGNRRPFEGWEPDMGISAKFLRVLCQWIDDDRFAEGRGKIRTWDEFEFCKHCKTPVSHPDDACEECGGRESFTPQTPTVLYFEETHEFEAGVPDEYLPIETSADLVAAVLEVLDIDSTPEWWNPETDS